MKEHFFIDNRVKLADKIEDNSIVLMFQGGLTKRLGDEDYPFTPERNLYYLTNIGESNIIFMLFKGNNTVNEYLFIRRSDPVKAKWVGESISREKAEEKSGISNILYLDDFEETFSSLVFNKRIENIYFNFEIRNMNTNNEEIAFAEKIRKTYPYINIKNVYPVISQLRTIKGEWEIENIKNAISITKEGILNILKNAKAGMYEYELEAYFDFVLKSKGVKEYAFKTIVASGKNATILHYSDNNCKTEKNDLVLCDSGATYNYYSGDITRTFPVSGKFTKRQREIYSIVLEAQKYIISLIKPNVPFSSLNEKLKDFYFEKLKKIGLVKEKEEVSKYYYHGVSHLLGLETHDVGRHNEGCLQEGMVLTVEPGLYIEEEKIGIRIEDNVLVTKNGNEVLSKDIIKEIDDIEKFMEGKNV